MNRYEEIFESIQDKLDRAILTPQIAERLNDLAYEKYVLTESKKDDDLEMIDSLREKIDNGEVKLSKDIIEEIKELLGEEESDDDKEDEASDDKQADENGEGAEESE